MKTFFSLEKKCLTDIIIDYDALCDNYGKLNAYLLASLIIMLKAMPEEHVVTIHAHYLYNSKQLLVNFGGSYSINIAAATIDDSN